VEKILVNSLDKRRFLVTGGAGFIGSELVRQLVNRGAEVIVVDNLVNGKRENLEGIGDDRMRLEVLDIREQKRMETLMKKVDAVFHLACLGVRHSIGAPFENHEVNATGTLQMLSAAKNSGVSRFIYISSSEVYGTACWVPITEDHPQFPKTVYGSSKLAGEAYTRAFYDTYGYPTIIIRPFNCYGPRSHHEGDSGEVIPKFLLRCMAGLPLIIFGDGFQTRDFTYVSDAARGIIEIGCADNTVGQTYNLGSGKELTINALALLIAEIAGFQEPKIQHDEPRPGDVLRLFADSMKAHKAAGFEPRVSFEEGLKKLKEWYVQQGVSPEKLLEREEVRNWKIK
jgi:UDP-glucose 4-epimerase